MKKTILILTALTASLSAHALQIRSAKNENLNVFIDKSSTNKTLIEGISHTIVDKKEQGKAALPVIFGSARASRLPTRVETRTVMGYSPYKVTIVTLVNNSKQKIELESGTDLFATYRLIVNSKSEIFESKVDVDNLSLTSMTLSGQLAQDLKAVLIQLGAKDDGRGGVNFFGASTIYHGMIGSSIPSDASCGDLASNGKEICVIYNNFKN